MTRIVSKKGFIATGEYHISPNLQRIRRLIRKRNPITDIKKLKLKIQIKIQGDELRVDGKKKDDLQEAIAAIKAIDIGLPIDFVNFRD